MTVMRERRLNAEMRTTRDALRTSQERLAFAFAASGSLGWWDWDIPANRLYAGEQFARMYGVDPKEAAKGAPLAAFVDGIHPDDRSWVGERIQNALDTGGEFSEEYRLLRADGTLTWVYARGRCFLDDDGRPLRYPGVAVDITARKLADAARAVGEARLKSIMETVPVGILLAEAPSGRILMGNQRLAEILGHDTLYARQAMPTARSWPFTRTVGGSRATSIRSRASPQGNASARPWRSSTRGRAGRGAGS